MMASLEWVTTKYDDDIVGVRTTKYNNSAMVK
jgi:hypothetical protein